MSGRLVRLLAAIVGAGLLAGALWSSSAGAVADITITVDTTSMSPMSGQCSLPEAIAFADGTAEPGCSAAGPTGRTTINVDPGTYTLNATLDLTGDTDLVGAGASSTIVSGGGAVTVVDVSAGATVNLSDLTVTGGRSAVLSTGCSGTGVARNCPGETADDGGGIYNAGTLALSRVTVTLNAAADGTQAVMTRICVDGSCPAEAGERGGGGGNGGGIFNDTSGTLTVDHSLISNNASGSGGAGSDGLSGTGADASDGQAGGNGGYAGFGAGIASLGSLTITDSTISGNTAGNGGAGGSGSSATDADGDGGPGGNANWGGGGGGIVAGGQLTITDSTISQNYTGTSGAPGAGGAGSGSGASGDPGIAGEGGDGGGISYSNSSAATTFATLQNVTIFGNEARGAFAIGGGIYLYTLSSIPMQLESVTIADNQASDFGSAIDTEATPPEETGSIIADNSASPAGGCSGIQPVDEGGNLSSDASCPGTIANPRLTDLVDNGGPTETMALPARSPAAGLVPVADCVLTTDQRGAPRPQGAACDAGAYQIAPPTISAASATATAADSASISATVAPNLTDSRAVVQYGTSLSYGSSTSALDLGAGGGATPLSTVLTGLKPDTTYHAELVVTNQDGTSTSSDLSFATAPSMRIGVPGSGGTGPSLQVQLTCGLADGSCGGQIRLTGPDNKSVGSGAYAIAARQSETVTMTLNSAGVELLTKRYVVPATLALSGTSDLSQAVLFSYGRIRARVSLAGSRITGLPPGATVSLRCHGRGCPLGSRSLHPRGTTLAIDRRLRHLRLADGGKFTITITALDRVGEVFIYTRRHPRRPLARCLVPGARSPSRCV